MDKKQIIKIIKSLGIGESDSISELGAVTRDGEGKYTVTDNGEVVSGLDFNSAVRIAKENNEA
jgi:hypothetical protein